MTADLTADRATPRPARLSRDAEGWLFGIIGVVTFSFSLPATKTAVPHFGWLITSLGRAEVAALLAAVVLLERVAQPLATWHDGGHAPPVFPRPP